MLLAAQKKPAIFIATNMEKKIIFFTIVGRWYKELKVKKFCVFEHLELLFPNGLFQNNYFKNISHLNNVKVHAFELSIPR